MTVVRVVDEDKRSQVAKIERVMNYDMIIKGTNKGDRLLFTGKRL